MAPSHCASKSVTRKRTEPPSPIPSPPPSPGLDPEERRVFYVAVTRARERLTLSYCTFRREERTRPSPFLAEIGRGLLRRAELGTDEPRAPRRTPPRPSPPVRGPKSQVSRLKSPTSHEAT